MKKAVWEFAAMSEKKDLVVNSVVPNINWGPLLDVRQKASSGSFIPSIYEHGLDALGSFKNFPPRMFHLSIEIPQHG